MGTFPLLSYIPLSYISSKPHYHIRSYGTDLNILNAKSYGGPVGLCKTAMAKGCQNPNSRKKRVGSASTSQNKLLGEAY